MQAKPCELCFQTNSGANKEIGCHIVCTTCLKKLRIWKEKTIKKHKKMLNDTCKLHKFPIQPYSDVIKTKRLEVLRQMIFWDIVLEKVRKIEK